MRVGVVGVGHLGKEHARVYSELDGADLIGVVDTDPERAKEVSTRLGVRSFDTPEKLVPHVDAVSIVVPTPLHLEAAFPFLEAGKALLVEKPLAETCEQAERILELAAANDSVLQVGHIERFNPIVEAALPLIQDPLFIECDRIHPFSLRSTDVSVVLDLMIHDLDLALLFAGDEVASVDAVGTSVLSPTHDLANATLRFRRGGTAIVRSSRMALRRSRKVRIFCERAYITLDLVERTGMSIQLRDGYDPRTMLDASGRISAPQGEAAFLSEHVNIQPLVIPAGEPLRGELSSFLEAARRDAAPRVTGRDGLRALRIAHDIEARMDEHRRKVLSQRDLS